MEKLTHFRTWLYVAIACLVAATQTTLAYETADADLPSPVVWRFPLYSGYNARLYLLDDKILVYEDGGNSKLIDLEGNLLREWQDDYTHGLNTDESCGVDRRWVEDRKFWLTRDHQPESGVPLYLAKTRLIVSDFAGKVIAEYPVESPLYSRGIVYISNNYLISEGDSEQIDLPSGVWLAQMIKRDGKPAGDFELHQDPKIPPRDNSSYMQLGNAIVYSDARGIHCVSENGTTLWDNDDADLAFSKLYKYQNGDICAFAYSNGFLARVSGKGDTLWKAKIGQMDRRWEIETPPHAMDKQGRFYYAGGKMLQAIDPDGQVAWKHFGQQLDEINVGANGELYCWSRSQLYSLDTLGRQTWRDNIFKDYHGKTLTGPYGRLYIVNGNELYCIDPANYPPSKEQEVMGYLRQYSREDGTRAAFSYNLNFRRYSFEDHLEWDKPIKFGSGGEPFLQSGSGTLSVLSGNGSIDRTYPWRQMKHGYLEKDGSIATMVIRWANHPEFVEKNYDQDYINRNWNLLDVGVAQEIIVTEPDGSIRWRYRFGDNNAISGFAAFNDSIYVFGEKVWRLNWDGELCDEVDGGHFYNNVVELPNGNLVLSYIRPTAGFEVWDADYQPIMELDLGFDDEYFQLSIFPNGESTVLVKNDGFYFETYNISGKPIWSGDFSDVPKIRSFPYTGGISAIDQIGNFYFVYFNQRSSRIVSVSPEGELNWEFEDEAEFSGLAFGADGNVYFTRKFDGVTCLNSDGEVLWEENGIGFVNSAPSIGPDGLVYVRTYEGVVALEP